MKGMDSEMMEAEEAASPQVAMMNTDVDAVFRDLLTAARKLVDEGKPSQALQAVAMAIKVRGGDEQDISLAVHRARELYINKVRDSAAADDLASLFAECGIAEVIPQNEPSQHDMDAHLTEPDAQGSSILAESGRAQVVIDAFSDGSSFICFQCGGLVSCQRREEHLAFWCCKN